MPDGLDLRRLEVPVIQAGMGGISRHELAAAVSDAGDCSETAGVRAPIAGEIAAARKITGRPIAVNLLLPFLRPGDAAQAAGADAIVTFWGQPRPLRPPPWPPGPTHTDGSTSSWRAGAARPRK